mmetsp:Transcript_86949/g.153985  ORF Transcript_86949/g.153985 Transcript_86949/m.153985 type:complete len:453 (+) Transcript_86949:61-1419(+)
MGAKQPKEKVDSGASTEKLKPLGGGAPCGTTGSGRPKPMLPRTWQGWQVPPRYEVMKIIGKGSYGSVCQANDNVKNQHVAIKQLKHLFDDLIDCKRILRELAILTRLDSDHCVRVHDIFIPEGSFFDELYIVLEMCDSDMKKLVKSDVHLNSDMVTSLLYNLLVGLKYIHSAGIYHRDLKPANCLVNQNCEVKICDFGLARALGGEQGKAVDSMSSFKREDSSDEEGTGSVPVAPATLKKKRYLTQHVVTRWYRAPEIILLQTGYNEAIDIWSVGCIYAELMQMSDEDLRVQDRGPLFPGQSCAPLSPEHRSKGKRTRHHRDQLEVIFNVLGTPSEEEMKCLENEDAKKYVRGFSARKGDGLSSVFEGKADPGALGLLEKMLRFSPKARCTVLQALEDPQLEAIRDVRTEALAPGLVSLDFEDGGKMTEDMLKRCFRDEIRKFHERISGSAV